MSFADKMKAANGLNLGLIESPDFPAGIIILKGGCPTIINKAIGGPSFEVPIKKEKIKVFKLLGCGGEWAKYLLVFKDGRSGVITQDVYSQSQSRANGGSMASIERFIKFTDYGNSPYPVGGQAQQAPDGKHCPSCGAEIDDEMLFCGECGGKLK